MYLLNKKCLVLNAGWFPASVTTVFRSIKMALNGNGKIVHTKNFRTYSFKEWVEKGVEENDYISTSRIQFDIPKVIIATNYRKLYRNKVQLNHPNVYRRDGHSCWYCKSKRNLTWDHIIPKCKSGKHCWDNVITCCRDCNNQKDNLDVEEFCQIKGCAVPSPKSLIEFPWLIEVSEVPTEWLNFMKNKKG